MKHFTPISGYKVVSKCRNCGKKHTGKKESYYCDECLEKLRSWREKAAEEKAKAEGKTKAKKKTK